MYLHLFGFLQSNKITIILQDSGISHSERLVTGIENIPQAIFAVKAWTEERSVDLIQQILSNIIGTFERDFAKHPDPKDFPESSLVWKSIPSHWQEIIKSSSIRQ